MSPKHRHNIKTSSRIIQSVIILVWLIMLGRLFQLQILSYDTYAPLSKENFIRQEFIHPARGLIYDRNGTIIVENEPIYSITVTPASFDMSKTSLLAGLLDIDEEEVADRLHAAQQYSWHRTSRLFTEVSFDVFSNIQENIWQLPGISHQIESKRHYPHDFKASHALGYLREATRKEYLDSGTIRLGDKIGKSGVEMVYEDYLKGELGTEYNRVNAYGQALGDYDDNQMNIAPVKGNDVISTLDAGLQELAEKLMEGKRGGLVAMDPNSGEILSIVSAPQYDISRLAGRVDGDYWSSVNLNKETPLFNRAISSLQPPGSTFKPFMGLIGLHLGLITKDTQIYNSGAYMRGRPYGDLADVGNYDLVKALTKSSNTFFFHMMDRIATEGYLNTWSRLAKDFGIGRKNHIDLPFETSGIMPDSTYMNANFGERGWGVGDLMSLGVGQGMVSVSPLQMAVAVSSIANGGFRVQPHLVRGIFKGDGSVSYTNPERTRIEWVREDHLQIVRQGMRGVVEEGSGRWYSDLNDIAVAGKTGTSQNPHGENHGWYIAYAPFDDPQIAVAVLVENAGFGSISAAPVAALVIEQYLKGEIERQHVLDYVLNFTPRSVTPDGETEQVQDETLLETGVE
ncbi:MAG: penicillin-binding protein 2 [Balneolaceae bacterium]